MSATLSVSSPSSSADSINDRENEEIRPIRHNKRRILDDDDDITPDIEYKQPEKRIKVVTVEEDSDSDSSYSDSDSDSSEGSDDQETDQKFINIEEDTREISVIINTLRPPTASAIAASCCKLIRREGKSAKKNEIVSRFANHTCEALRRNEIFQNSPIKSMYIEGPSARTSKALLLAGLPKSSLLPICFDKEKKLKRLRAIIPDTANEEYRSLVDEVDGLDNNVIKPASIWLDYCCTWFGNTTEGYEKDVGGKNIGVKQYCFISPKDDLRNTLRWYVQPGTYVGLTFSFRSPFHRDIKRSEMFLIYKKEIAEVIREYGWCATFDEDFMYNSDSMVYFGFTVKKCTCTICPGTVTQKVKEPKTRNGLAPSRTYVEKEREVSKKIGSKFIIQ
jgi:hypothetical protein